MRFFFCSGLEEPRGWLRSDLSDGCGFEMC